MFQSIGQERYPYPTRRQQAHPSTPRFRRRKGLHSMDSSDDSSRDEVVGTLSRHTAICNRRINRFSGNGRGRSLEKGSCAFNNRRCIRFNKTKTDSVSRSQRNGSPRPYSKFLDRNHYFFSKELLICTQEAEWTPFQTHCFSKHLVTPGIEPGTSGSVARNSDH
jgi:hypothetical protein